jgi:hypothetical protein
MSRFAAVIVSNTEESYGRESEDQEKPCAAHSESAGRLLRAQSLLGCPSFVPRGLFPCDFRSLLLAI